MADKKITIEMVERARKAMLAPRRIYEKILRQYNSQNGNVTEKSNSAIYVPTSLFSRTVKRAGKVIHAPKTKTAKPAKKRKVKGAQKKSRNGEIGESGK